MTRHTVREQVDYMLGRGTNEPWDLMSWWDDGYPLWQAQVRERVQRAQSRRWCRRNARRERRAMARIERMVERLRREQSRRR